MSEVLKNLEPKEVFYFFEQICNIPHGSGNTDKISEYLVDFAKERNLEYIQDSMKNVIIIKEATEGYENQEPVIIQGHMDMVAVKKPDCDIDMKNDPLRLAIDGDNIYAEGTSLGGDDGIAVAYALALLDAKDIPHPRLEVVITVDEEVGMYGAIAVDLSMLKGHRMLNIDSEEEGFFLTSCAGGARVTATLPIERMEKKGTIYDITISGLKGGHSGCEIEKERGNSHCLVGRLLAQAKAVCDYAIVSIAGGVADNAIPRQTTLRVLIPSNEAVFEQYVSDFENTVAKELETKEPDFALEIKRAGVGKESVITAECAENVVNLLFTLPNGVQAMSLDVEGLVETSLNMGIVTTTDDTFKIMISVRSSIESAKKALLDKVERIIKLCNATSVVDGQYPGWAYRKDSPFRDKMVRIYEEMYGKKPVIQAIHAGLECGIIAEKIPDLDCVSLGPDMKNIHTTEETLSISSAKRVWEYCLEVLRQKEE